MADHSLKRALDGGGFVLAPGVFDMMSLLMADKHDFQALYFSGFWNAASALGIPDAGLATYRDFISQISKITKMTSTPLIADADTGFGGLLNLDHTVRGYEEAGVAAIQIEDQVSPKKCGHQPGRQVVPLEEMVTRVQVAVAARTNDDFKIIARTDARDIEGLDKSILRAQAYHAAGADITFIEAPRSIEEMRRICQDVDAPQMVNMAHGGRAPILSASELEDIGYAIAIVPSAPALGALQGLSDVYAKLADGVTNCEDHLSLYDFQTFCDDIGFPDIRAFEKKWADKD